jgi:hypothetical protein
MSLQIFIVTLILGLGPTAILAVEHSGDLALAQSFYAERPREEQPQAGWQALPNGLADLRASTCGTCHPAIYQEWKVSTHAQAWIDPQFQAEITKSGNRWLCSNCHTPLLNQMQNWAVGLKGGDVEKPLYTANIQFDPGFRAEGITCAACHVRNGAVEGPTGNLTEAHPTRRADRFTDSSICLACHQAVRSYPGKDFICVFETGQEWEDGPYGRTQQGCQVCHMQPVDRPIAEGGPIRSGRRHYFPGSGIYKQTGVGPPLDQLAPGLAVTASTTEELLAIRLENSFSGHRLPTGDPERFILVVTKFFSASGQAVGTTNTERIGQTWQWWPEPLKLGDNRLAPLEVREVRLARPSYAQSWKITVTNHRIGEEAAQFHGLVDYPRSRVTHRLEGEFPSR